MAKYAHRTIRLYTMHARSLDGVLDYADFTRKLASVDATASIVEINSGMYMALDNVRDDRNVYTAKVVVGHPDDVPLYFDYRTGNTETGQTPEGKWLAQVTRVVIDPDPDVRLVALEGTNAGATSARLAKYFEMLSDKQQWFRKLSFDLVPIPAKSLLDEINDMERIREAATVISRPNYDWSDMADGLSELAAESGGHEAQASVKAARGESLAKDAGIVETIKESFSQATPSLKSFRIWGRKHGSSKEVMISSEKNQERTTASIPAGSDVSTVDGIVDAAAKELIAANRSRAVANDDISDSHGS